MSPVCSLNCSASAKCSQPAFDILHPSTYHFAQTSPSAPLFHFRQACLCFGFSVCVHQVPSPLCPRGKRTIEFCSVARHSGSVRLSPHLHNKNEVRAFPRRSAGLPPISTNTHPHTHTNTRMHSLSCSRHGTEIAGSQ